MSTINFESSLYVPVEFGLANAGQRLLAAILDMLLFIIYFIVILAFFGESLFFNASSFGDFFWLFLVKLPWIFYNPFCEYFMHGQTIGKYIVGIRVVTMNGGRPMLKEVFTRWIFKGDFLWISVNAIILLWFGMGLIAILVISFSQYSQRMADVLSNTLVIQSRPKERFSLNDLLKIVDTTNHEVKYPQVTCFADEDMLLIKNTINRLREYPTPEAIQFGQKLCDETAKLMEIPPITEKRMEFLQNVLEDYVVLTR
ncbi:MAG: RDD family protein [Crocinitomicaceae bacterium]|nr:RDD family protein [Crocinitomicaceae bacterium]